MAKKGGWELNNTIILLLLAVAIVIVAIAGWGKITPLFKTGNIIQTGGNSQEIIEECHNRCNVNDVRGFCITNRTIDVGRNEYTGTCQSFAQNKDSLGNDIPNYGISSCPICPS